MDTERSETRGACESLIIWDGTILTEEQRRAMIDRTNRCKRRARQATPDDCRLSVPIAFWPRECS